MRISSAQCAGRVSGAGCKVCTMSLTIPIRNVHGQTVIMCIITAHQDTLETVEDPDSKLVKGRDKKISKAR